MRLFGTNGVRGVSNKDMSPELALRLGKAIGSHVSEGSSVALAKDPRVSGDMLKGAVVSGLLSAGVNVVDIGMLPTPALQYYVKHHDFSAGVMITASHNPPEFNGIKVIAADGTEMSKYEEGQIESLYFSRKFRASEWKNIGKLTKESNAGDFYIDGILSSVDREKIMRKRFLVVLDCANGASAPTSPYLLRKLGCRVISLNAQPDGMFPGHESEPSPQNLKTLVDTVRFSGADIGIAHDGDADRVIFVDEKANYLYGDRSLSIVAKYQVEKNKGAVVTPVSSSTAVEDAVKSAGGTVIYTQVGAPVVARKMIETGAVFGGEENGGLIFPEHQYCRDGAMGAAKMLEIMAKSEKSLSELEGEIPKYALYKTKTRCPNELKEKVLERLTGIYANLGHIDRTDGLKVYTDEGWILIRPSGTEPIYRIFAESKDMGTAKSMAEKGRENIERIINGF